MITTYLSSVFLVFHAYYISFTEMEFNPKTNDVEVSIKLTGHDLEKEIQDLYQLKVEFGNQSDLNDSILNNYFTKKMNLSQNGKVLKLGFDGYEYDLSGDLFVFFHFEKFKPKKGFVLTNQILLKNFPQQQNIVNFKIGEHKYQKTLTIKSFDLVSD